MPFSIILFTSLDGIHLLIRRSFPPDLEDLAESALAESTGAFRWANKVLFEFAWNLLDELRASRPRSFPGRAESGRGPGSSDGFETETNCT